MFSFVVIFENFERVFIVFLLNKLFGKVCMLLMVVWNLKRMIVIMSIVIVGVFGLDMVINVGSIIK